MESELQYARASQLVLEAQQAITSQLWAKALDLAGLAICYCPDWCEPFMQIAHVCFQQRDFDMGRAYLELSKNIANSDYSTRDRSHFDINSLTELGTKPNQDAVQPATPIQNRSNPLPASFRLIAGGDVMLGRQLPGWVERRGSQSPFEELAPLFKEADLALVNLETCVSTIGDFLDKGGRQPYYYRNLPDMLDVLVHAGISVVATGNNHAMDFGAEALAQQTSILNQCGFINFGAGRNVLDAALPKYAIVNGIIVAFIGAETETPSMAAQAEIPGVHFVQVEDLARILAGPIAIARAHADIVIVSPHWGPNWKDTPTHAVQQAARLLIDLGADAVLGHSSHLLQGVEFHAGRPIVYDMGTLLFDRVAQSTMRNSAVFDLMWSTQGTCQLTIHPVKLSNAKARKASGEDFVRVCDLISRLSHALDPQVVIEATESGLHLRSQPGNSPMRSLIKLPVPGPDMLQNQPAVPTSLREMKANVVYTRLPAMVGAWTTPLRVNANLEILGARFASPVRAERGFVCEVYFRAPAPTMPSRVEARIVGLSLDGQEAFVYIHPVADGIHPSARWSQDEIICDRIVVRPVKAVADGIYQLCWSLVDLDSGQAMPIEAVDTRILNNQIYLGDLLVNDTAPNGVAGITAATRMPKLPPTQDANFGGWHTRVLDFWEQEARPWVVEALAKIGLAISVVQPVVVKDAPWVLVIRLETGHGAYYFKALEAINHFEPGLLQYLADEWPDQVPAPLATCTERAWMLTPDYGIEVRALRDNHAKNAIFRSVLSNYATLQIETCTRVNELLALGVPDQRIDLLSDLFERLLSDAQTLQLGDPGGLQVKEQEQALHLLPKLRACCTNLARQPWAIGLDHGDLHVGNVLTRGTEHVLFDWDIASVTHPFCSLLLPYHASGLQDANALTSMQALADAYLAPWVQKTGRSLADLTLSLHHALWVAHAKRALFWAQLSDADEVLADGSKQTLVAKWVRLFIQRQPLLLGASSMPHPDKDSPLLKPHPPKLATPDNPLLLDAKKIADITGGTWERLPKDVAFTGISFNRKYIEEGSSGNLYFAVKSDPRDETFDAESIESVRKAVKAGACAVVVPQHAPPIPDEFPILRVPHLRNAFDQLGQHVRDHLYTGKRLLVSGTEGKTGFKNMLRHVLSPQISTHAVTNSSNLGFSIRASLASIRQNDRVAILEAAGTHPGRLKDRSSLVKPHLFVLTEVGNEHINFHGSQQAVIESKADIVTGLVEGGYGILNADSANYAAVRRAVLKRRRVPLLLFGSGEHCNGRLLAQSFTQNGWNVSADIEGQQVHYRVPLLGNHVPLATVSVLLAAYYLGADVVQAAAEFIDYQAYESQGVLRRIAHGEGEFACYDNASRASVLSYQSTLRMAALLTPPDPCGKKVAVIGQMIFLGTESVQWHAKLAEWVDAAGFDKVVLVGKFAEVTYANLRKPERVVQRFPEFDRRYSSKKDLQALIDAVEIQCAPGDLLFIKGEVDELGQHFQSQEIPADAPMRRVTVEPKLVRPAPARMSALTDVDESALAGLRLLQRDDLPRYRSAIDSTQRTVCQHYFPMFYLLGQTDGIQMFIEEDAGSICIYRLRTQKDKQDLCLFLLPMPFQAAVLERCIARVKSFNRSDRASLFRVDSTDADPFRTRPNTRVVACPEEYIYAPNYYKDLSGNKNGNLRRAVQHIQRRDDLEVLNYQASDAVFCKQVLEHWGDQQRKKYGSMLYGSYTERCLELYDQFPRSDLFGKVIKLNGEICAFGFAGEIRSNLGHVFIAYSNLEIDGLNRFLWFELLRGMAHLDFVNGSHADDAPGLAFAKKSLRPAYMSQPYQVYAG